MVRISVDYVGEKHCELTHGPSGSKIETDAPKDNQGKGEKFSPTDLMAAALGSCILTTIAIIAEKEGIHFEKASCEVEKIMTSNPRRVSALKTILKLPEKLSFQERQKVEQIARNCPV